MTTNQLLSIIGLAASYSCVGVPMMSSSTFFSQDYMCDESGRKMCTAVDKPPQCEAGEYWDDNACMCFGMMKCRMMCPAGQMLDPRYACECVDVSVVKDLEMCGPDEPRVVICPFPEEPFPFEPVPEPVIELPPPEKQIDQCFLTVDDCPSANFDVNPVTCQCECNIMCIMTMSFDPKTCSCVPIKDEFGFPINPVYPTPLPVVVEPTLAEEPVELTRREKRRLRKMRRSRR